MIFAWNFLIGLEVLIYSLSGQIILVQSHVRNVSDDLAELMEMLTPQDLDWGFIAENIDAWVEKAELEFIQ